MNKPINVYIMLVYIRRWWPFAGPRTAPGAAEARPAGDVGPPDAEPREALQGARGAARAAHRQRRVEEQPEEGPDSTGVLNLDGQEEAREHPFVPKIGLGARIETSII